MSCLKKMIAKFTEPSGEATQSIYFQGSTLFNLIITTPLVVVIPNVGPHAQSRLTIPNPKQKRGTRRPVTKKLKKTATAPIVNLTSKVDQSISTLPIIEENPPSSCSLTRVTGSIPTYNLHPCDLVQIHPP